MSISSPCHLETKSALAEAALVSLEQECSALQTELTVAESVLAEQELSLAERELKNLPLTVWQELSSKINQQRAVCNQLRKQFQQKEAELGEHRRRDGAAFERQQRITKRTILIEQIQSMDDRLRKSGELRMQMQQQEQVIAGEKNALLAELGRLEQSYGGMN